MRDVLGPSGSHINVLAKIDTIESLHNFEEIIRSSQLDSDSESPHDSNILVSFSGDNRYEHPIMLYFLVSGVSEERDESSDLDQSGAGLAEGLQFQLL